MELPLCFDFEYDSVQNARKQGVNVTKELASEMLWQFGSRVEEGGYWCLNYTSPDFMDRYYGETTAARFGLWLASWPTAKVFDLNKPPRKCDIWQWTSKGSVAGIAGNVDISESYIDFPKAIGEANLNHLSEAPSYDALKWAKEHNITSDPDMALAFWNYHKAFNK